MSPSDAAAHPAKPDRIFDREAEWAALVSFVDDPRPGATLGLVSGQRRQGKTLLLEAVAGVSDGFYFDGHAAAEAETLRRLAERFGEHTRAARPPRWQRWEDAVDALLALGDQRPAPVIIDNFPDLVTPSPTLPSVIHGAFRRLQQVRRDNRARLILGGGTPSLMRRLFSGPSSLHQLASLELLVEPFDFRKAAEFWGIRSPRLAVQVHAVVGGTPAYRGDLVCDDAPAGPRTSTPGCAGPSSTPVSRCTGRRAPCWRGRTTRTGRCPTPRWSRSRPAAPPPVRSPNAPGPS
ncbi:ATP-binding protein [Streptomyces lydicus]|uniref:ATP-binding protein n=1 Tax=Streptomyces lydicus TaxID=47763 RepID=UPI00379BEBA1